MYARIQLEGIGFPRQEFINLLQYQIDNHNEELFHEGIMGVVMDDELLTHDMIQAILDNLDKERFQNKVAILESSIAKGNLLNRPHLIRSVYRLVEYFPTKDFVELLKMGLLLRSNVLPGDVGFRNDRVYHIPRFQGHKCGLSCSTDRQFNLRSEILGTRSLPYNERDMLREFRGNVRAFLVYFLPEKQIIDPANWHLENDGAKNDTCHVTLAAEREFDAVDPPYRLNMVRIPELELLPWGLVDEGANPVLLLRASADWRHDFLPEREEWENLVITTLNKILKLGEVDDFVNVWRLHRMMMICDSSDSSNFVRIIDFAQSIISSYLHSDIHDPHDPDHVAYAASRFLEQLQTKS